MTLVAGKATVQWLPVVSMANRLRLERRRVPSGPYWNAGGFIDWLDEHGIEWAQFGELGLWIASRGSAYRQLARPGLRVRSDGVVL